MQLITFGPLLAKWMPLSCYSANKEHISQLNFQVIVSIVVTLLGNQAPKVFLRRALYGSLFARNDEAVKRLSECMLELAKLTACV